LFSQNKNQQARAPTDASFTRILHALGNDGISFKVMLNIPWFF
jgi:hypothetical protein